MKIKHIITSILFTVSMITLIAVFSSCNGICKHEYESDNAMAVCDREVVSKSVCSKCGDIKEAVLSPTGHTFTETNKESTCDEAGYTEYTCHCGFSYHSDISSAPGHDYQQVVTSPTCDKAGYTLNVCRVCDHTYRSDTVAPLGHNMSKKDIPPSCTEEGFSESSCSRCDYSFTSDYISPLGHKYVEETVAPTCTEEGYTVYACSACDHSYNADHVRATGHRYTSEVETLSNCTTAGTIVFTCGCGDSYTEITPPHGHSFDSITTLPTLSDMGYTEYSCSECGECYTGDYLFYSSVLQNAYASSDETLAKGIDVSVYNHTADSNGFLPLDWTAISNEDIDYVILKAGSTLRENGTKGGIDATFNMDYTDAKAAGLDLGVYFYTYAKTVEEIRTDAYMLLAILDGKQFEYPIYLDLEDESLRELGSHLLNEMCFEFFTILQRAGYYTGLYVNHEWLYNVINTGAAINSFDIWYARYPADPDSTWDTEQSGKPFGMWQYTDSGILESASHSVFDMNYCYKDYPSLIKELGYNGYGGASRFQDDGKSFVWINISYLTVRSTPDFDSTDNVLAYASYGSRFEVLEAANDYTKILYQGQEAYISANLKYISFSPVWEGLN